MTRSDGKGGTLTRYKVTYRDGYDAEGEVIETWFTWAYDAEHAEDKFYDDPCDWGVVLDVVAV